MKILFIRSSIHHKNINFILKSKIIDFTIIDSIYHINNYDLSLFDVVVSPCDPIDVSKYPNTKFIFGPQFSVFPEHNLNLIQGNIYNLLSDWVVNIWNKYEICQNMKLVTLPFGVETELFQEIKPICDRNQVFVYFKNRNPSELKYISEFLNSKSIQYSVFSYNNRYNENEYLSFLQNSKYGIWIGTHESQGFALQEALSCNVPLFVWNVTSMNQEWGQYYNNIPATSIPYWDERCGEVFYDANELEVKYNTFINNIGKYKPRDFIIENLSIEVCENRWIEFIKNI
jgi:hypothetical protein